MPCQHNHQSRCSIICLNIPRGFTIGVDCSEYRATEKFRGFTNVPSGLHIIHFSSARATATTDATASDDMAFLPDGADVRRSMFLYLSGSSSVAVLTWDEQSEDLVLVRECESEEELFDTGLQLMDDSKSGSGKGEGSDRDGSEDDSGCKNDHAANLERMLHEMVLENRTAGTGLAPYPMEQYGKWQRLIDHIKWSTVDRLQPVGRKILSSVESAPVDPKEESKLLQQLQEYEKSRGLTRASIPENRPHVSVSDINGSQGTTIFFTHIPRRLTKKGAPPEEITRINFDKSELLEQLLSEKFNGDEDAFIAEFQFAFVCFYICHNLHGFEQWKSIVHLLCNCDDAIQFRPLLFVHFVHALHAQVEVIPEDFFSGDLQTDNFLYHCLSSLFEIVLTDASEEAEELVGRDIQKLTLATQELQWYVKEKFEWQLDSEEDLIGDDGYEDRDDDYGPTVVK